MRIAYLLKKFPRLSETFVLGEILGQEALGAPVTIFSRRQPDDEPRHAALSALKAEVEVLPSSTGLAPWLELFGPDPVRPDLLERMGTLVREHADLRHDRLPALLAEALWLLRRTTELEIDHVHVHFATDAAVTAMLLEGLGGPGYSITAHAKDIYRSTVDPRMLSRVVERSRFMVTVCDANVDFLSGLLSEPAQARVRRIYNGIDLASFAPDGSPREERLILSAGRLVEKKGFDVLIEALAVLAGRGEPFAAEIIGDGDQREKLEALVRERGLEGKVTLLGALDQDGVRERMRRATLFCLPCVIGEDGNRDALPTVLLEALAAELPCVSTPVSGVPEILDHGRAGILVPENDLRATADAIAELLHDPQRRAKLAHHGRVHAERLFDSRGAARELHACFEAALSAVCP